MGRIGSPGRPLCLVDSDSERDEAGPDGLDGALAAADALPMRGSAARWTRWDVAGIPLWGLIGLASLAVAAQGEGGHAVLLALSGLPALVLGLASLVAWLRGAAPVLPGRSTSTQNALAFAFLLAWLYVGFVVGIMSDDPWPTALLYNANGMLIGMLLASRVRDA